MKKNLGTLLLILLLTCVTILSASATEKKYEQVSGVKHIKNLSINTKSSNESQIELEFINSNLETWQPIINVIDEHGLVWKGEEKIRDSSLGKYKVEILFYDTYVSESLHNELKLDTKKNVTDNETLIEAFRLFYPPDDSMAGLYFGCNSEPEVSFIKQTNKIIVTVKSKN